MAHDHHDHENAQHAHDHTHMDFAEIIPRWSRRRSCRPAHTPRPAGWLRDQRSETGLIVDAGSGPGVISCLLADTFPAAQVVAVDEVKPCWSGPAPAPTGSASATASALCGPNSAARNR